MTMLCYAIFSATRYEAALPATSSMHYWIMSVNSVALFELSRVFFVWQGVNL